jgi:hypothetical protein
MVHLTSPLTVLIDIISGDAKCQYHCTVIIYILLDDKLFDSLVSQGHFLPPNPNVRGTVVPVYESFVQL